MKDKDGNLMSPKHYNIGVSWAVFANTVMPVNCSEVQYLETKKAFYAGFLECFQIMIDYSETMSEEDASNLFDRLSKEGHDFFEKLIKEHKARR